MTDERKKELEQLANEKANALIYGETFTDFESELINRQINSAEIPGKCRGDVEPCAPLREIAPPTVSEEKEIYYRGMIKTLAENGRSAHEAIEGIVKHFFNNLPDETAALLLRKSCGAFGICDYTIVADVIRALSQQHQIAEIVNKIVAQKLAEAKEMRPRVTQRQAAEYILRAEQAANITNRSLNIDSIIRRVKSWDSFINSSGTKGTRPPAGYSRRNPPDAFALWARDVYVKDERYNKNNREK